MSNEKISIYELADQIAESTGMLKKNAEVFLREFLQVLETSLVDDNSLVKIKGLGTFKNIKVEARKSVNVQTGEEIEIPAHLKITFTPENSIKELVNKPYAHLETVIIEDDANLENTPLEREDMFASPILKEQAEEIASVLDEIKALDKEDETKSEKTEIEMEKVDVVITENVDAAKSEVLLKEEVSCQTSVNDETEKLNDEKEEKKVVKKSRKGRWIFLIIFLLILVSAAGVYKFYLEDYWYQQEKAKMLRERAIIYDLSE